MWSLNFLYWPLVLIRFMVSREIWLVQFAIISIEWVLCEKTNRRVFILEKCVLELKLVSQMRVAIHRVTKCVHFIVKISIETDTHWHTHSFNRNSYVTLKLHTNRNHVIHRRYTVLSSPSSNFRSVGNVCQTHIKFVRLFGWPIPLFFP